MVPIFTFREKDFPTRRSRKCSEVSRAKPRPAFGMMRIKIVCGALAPWSSGLRASASMSCLSVSEERRLLRGVLEEALKGTHRKRVALEQQLERHQEPQTLVGLADEDKASKARSKAAKALEQLPVRLAEADAANERLTEMLGCLRTRDAPLSMLRREMEEFGLAARLQSFDVEAMARSQWGRPDGFDGLVIESQRGVPILIARRSFKDALLRRICRGSDLWFQVREGSGSRVLLRTSMLPNLARSPRECMEMAADCAAFFSDWRCSIEDVGVMFTDSRHVAKRGTRVGQLRDSKRLGFLRARPKRVAELARDAQEEQGWM